MSVAYDDYLDRHLANVVDSFRWLKDKLGDEIGDDIFDAAEWNVVYGHDSSKYSEEEYDQYDAYFYGSNPTHKVKEDFDYAWLNHIHNNKHHWQYWVLINDDKSLGTKALEMPKEYVIEMICDWWSFSRKAGDLYEIFDWYDKHKDYMVLHKNTKKYVNDILGMIKKELDKEKEELKEDKESEV